MKFSVIWKPSPLKFLKKLEKKESERILDKIDVIQENPFRYLEHYEGDFYKLRIGDYRALIDFDKKMIIIEVLDKRGRIYK